MGIPDIQPNQWMDLSIKHWWSTMTKGSIPNIKAIASLTLLLGAGHNEKRMIDNLKAPLSMYEIDKL
jgi:hypothetical protein